MGTKGEYLAVFDDLISHREGARRRAHSLARQALNDDSAWSPHNQQPYMGWILEGLGFPEGMNYDAKSRYWKGLCEAGILGEEWRLKAGLILRGLGKRPFSWLQGQLSSGRCVYEISASINDLLLGIGSPISISNQIPVLRLIRYGYERRVLEICPLLWELILVDRNAVEARVLAAAKRILNDTSFWKSPRAILLPGRLLHELGLPETTSQQAQTRVQKRLQLLPNYALISHFVAALALYALDFDPVVWAKEHASRANRGYGKSKLLNNLLAQGGYTARISRSAMLSFFRIVREGDADVPRQAKSWLLEGSGLTSDQIRANVREACELALVDKGFWSRGMVLKRWRFVQEVVRQRLSHLDSTQCWEDLMRLGFIDPSCSYAFGLALMVIGEDSFRWVRENYQVGERGSLLNLVRIVNLRLSSAGFAFQFGERESSVARLLNFMIQRNAL